MSLSKNHEFSEIGSCDPVGVPTVFHAVPNPVSQYRGAVYTYSCIPGYIMKGNIEIIEFDFIHVQRRNVRFSRGEAKNNHSPFKNLTPPPKLISSFRLQKSYHLTPKQGISKASLGWTTCPCPPAPMVRYCIHIHQGDLI